MTKSDAVIYDVRLRLTDAAGVGLAGLRVQAFDQDRGRPADRLGETTTAADGSARIAFNQAAAGGRDEGAPELFLQVHTADGKLVRQTDPAQIVPGDTDLGTVAVAIAPAPPASSAAPAGPMKGTPSGVTGASNAPDPNDASSAAGTNRIHGSSRRDVLAPRSPFYHGPYGRMFRQLPAWLPPGNDDVAREAAIRAIAALMVEPDGLPDGPEGENKMLPAGYTYFGQFVDHDITFDPASSLTRLNDPDRLIDFRTPRFDLDNVYGEGPDDEPFMYDQLPERRGQFLIGKVPSSNEPDLPRNEQGTALIGDPRNDENVIVSQLQLAFLSLHNRVLARVQTEEKLTGREAFTRAQTLVRWHYQWVVLFDYLPRICGPVAGEVLKRKPDKTGYTTDLRFYKFRDSPYMPVEFSGAAYRFGHSQIRQRYDLNAVVSGVPIFLPPESHPGSNSDLRGFRRLPNSWTLDWRRFLDFGTGASHQNGRRIDERLSRALTSIPAGPDPDRGASLAALNLLRGWRLGLPSGQAVAKAIGIAPLSNDELGLTTVLGDAEAPLWFYVLKEAGQLGGAHLGPVGARIVAEVIVGLAKADPSCFLTVDPSWTPGKAFANGPALDVQGDALELSGLLRAAGRDGGPF